MAHYPSQSYQFEYADPPPSHHPLPNVLPYPTQDEYTRPAFFSYSPDVVKHRKRTSRAQRKVLEEAFRQNPKPSQYTRKLLIHQTGMDRRSLQVWFQNRRAKEKKVAAKTGTSTEPQPSSTPQGSDNSTEQKDESKESTESPPQSAPDETPADQPASPPARIKSAEKQPEKSNSVSPVNSGRPPLPPPKRPSDSTLSIPLRPHPYDFAHNMRRGSAPAPLGHPAPSPAVYMPDRRHHPVLGFPANYPAGMPWGNQADDLHYLRRGSLPATYLSGHSNGTSSPHLPPITSNQDMRIASLEQSRHRLASHPFAWQVASANSVLPIPGAPNLPVTLPSHLPHLQDPLSVRNSLLRSASTSAVPGRGVGDNYHVTHDGLNSLNGPLDHKWAAHETGHIRSRHHYPQPMLGTHLNVSEIVPGPLPQPGYSFGTPAAPIPEDDSSNLNHTEERDDRNLQRIGSQNLPPRFGSFASAISTDSSTVSSAIYSDGQSSDLLGDEEYRAPGIWHPDMRRASCPAPFMTAFADLAVNNNNDDQVAQSKQRLPGHVPSIEPQTRSLAAIGEAENSYSSPEDYYTVPSNSKTFPNENGYSGIPDYNGSATFQKVPTSSSETNPTETSSGPYSTTDASPLQ